MNALGQGYHAFREAMLNADPQNAGLAIDWDAFGRWESRCARYDLYWGLYQNNAYQNLVHPVLAQAYKERFGLPKHVRALYNPAYKLGSFYGNRLMGGSLDPEAGDGGSAPSALPIIADNDAVRPAGARLWEDSRWQEHKDTFAALGAVLGDVALRVVDDPLRGKVYLKIVHPAFLKWVDRDPFGNVKGYIFQERRADPRHVALAGINPLSDPRSTQRIVIYSEEVYRDGDDVVFRTYLNGSLHDWRDYPPGTPKSRVVGPEWREPYGFVPLWIASHEPSGVPGWAFSCFHTGLSRFREVDDLASGLSDQVRKEIRAPKMIVGVTPQDLQDAFPPPNPREPAPERDRLSYVAAPQGTTALDLFTKLDIAGVLAYIRDLNADVEGMYPELLADTGSMTGRVTAEAVRQSRTLASSKVQARRHSYDDVLARAMVGAIAIGGWRHQQGSPGDYDAYAPFGLDSFAAGTLALRIGHRPVFEVDPADERDADINEAQAVAAWVNNGVPLTIALRRSGWDESDIRAVVDEQRKQQQADLEMARAAHGPPGTDDAQGDQGGEHEAPGVPDGVDPMTGA